MALPENAIGFFDQVPLEPADVTDEVLDRLHSGIDDAAVLSWALARQVVRIRAHLPTRYLDPTDDADLFEEIMR